MPGESRNQALACFGSYEVFLTLKSSKVFSRDDRESGHSCLSLAKVKELVE